MQKFKILSSISPQMPFLTTIRAKFISFKAFSVFCSRFLPSASVSQNPAVSIRVTAPKFSNSTAFFTGSVVVPAKLDVMAAF